MTLQEITNLKPEQPLIWNNGYATKQGLIFIGVARNTFYFLDTNMSGTEAQECTITYALENFEVDN